MLKKFIENAKKLDNLAIKRILMGLILIVAQAAVFFIAAGRFDIFRAWYYIDLSVIYFLIRVIIVIETKAESRSVEAEECYVGKSMNKNLFTIYFCMTFVPFLVAGLETGRLNFDYLGIDYMVIGTILLIASFLFLLWSLIVNPLIMHGVHVGPYKYIRHPGYLGTIFSSLAVPLILGSVLALIPSLAVIILIIMRATLEDMALMKKSENYREYAKKVKYLMFPGIW